MNTRKYTFSPPYHRDSRLIIRPSYATTHCISYQHHKCGKYGHIKARYKQQRPFVKSHNQVN